MDGRSTSAVCVNKSTDSSNMRIVLQSGNGRSYFPYKAQTQNCSVLYTDQSLKLNANLYDLKNWVRIYYPLIWQRLKKFDVVELDGVLVSFIL